MQNKRNAHLTLLILILLPLHTSPQITQCTSYVKQLINDILDFKITSIPIPSLMYSGITTNNPGQMNQCLASNYSYYLVFVKNTTLMMEYFTGICVPRQCSADDIVIASMEFLRCRVYDGGDLDIGERVGFVGGVVVLGWIVLVIGCSLGYYFRQPVINQYFVAVMNREDQNADKPEIPSLVTAQNQLSTSLIPTPTQTEHPSQPSTETYSYTESKQEDNYIFSYYQGYKKIFMAATTTNNILSCILFLTVFSYGIAVEFSYRQNIAQNVGEIREELNSFWGIFICNVEISLQTIIFILGFRLACGLAKIRKFTKIGRLFFDELLRKWLNLILMSLLVYSFCTIFINKPLSLLWYQTNGKDCPNYIWQIWFVFRNLELDCKVCLPWFTLLEADLLLTLLTAPLIVLFRTSKKIGYFLIVVLIGGSIFVSSAILKDEAIIFQPSKLMNGQKQYWIDYQGNTFVRMGAFYLGLFFGLFVIEAMDRNREPHVENKIGDFLRKRPIVQAVLCLLGLGLMGFCYFSIRPYLDPERQDKQPYMYMILAPLGFVFGLSLLILPSYLQFNSPITKLLNKTLNWPTLIHLDRISLTFYLVAPMIIGYSTYSSQNSIMYNLYTVSLYLLGDLFITYFLCVLVTAIFENQLVPIVGWLRGKILGKETQYGDILIQYM